MEEKRKELKKAFSKHNIIVEIDEDASLEKVHALVIHNIFTEPSNSVEYDYYGIYYHHIQRDYDKTKMYYLMAINEKNYNSMNNLANYYYNIEKKYDQAKELYMIAVNNNNNIYAMVNLAKYYYNIEKDYDRMKKYALMAIEHKCSDAMHFLGWYYHTVEKQYDQGKKYYLMAIEHKHPNAMYNLAVYYQNVEKDYNQMKKYYLMAIEYDYSDATVNLCKYYQDKQKWNKALDVYMRDFRTFETEIKNLLQHEGVLLYLLEKRSSILRENKELKLENEHLKYKPGKIGANQAKEHFASLLT